MVVPENTEDYQAVTCTECDWLSYATNAEVSDTELVCPECDSELQIA